MQVAKKDLCFNNDMTLKDKKYITNFIPFC